MSPTEKPKRGDKVSWNWGGGAPGGTVAETKESGEIAIKSKRGNTIKKNASHDNPAVHVERAGNDVVKRASELTVETKASGNKKGKDDDDDDENEGESERARDEAGDAGDPHTINKQGKEVKKGGKGGRKRQKTSHENGDTSKVSGSEKGQSEEDTAGREDGRVDKKSKRANNANKTKESARSKKKTKSDGTQREGDSVSTRTRSHD
ncbi:hypothetical protein F5Y14DRAFT_451437 [Nemania sp. NC0429]|nr:hypothetical protein F5Y14DRAFT_451437 [Nemania sp. NC0429]